MKGMDFSNRSYMCKEMVKFALKMGERWGGGCCEFALHDIGNMTFCRWG